ncbi:MAG: sigma-54 dependent transcriptional regulator [Melioribacter sp.]|uniref:sigma-54-dependent transcriptional regulator n=1 Tax=Rosettibacter primus TaxID=3111523 RepID=UPI00247BF8D7|nr:sigma-54 dependent transcriptional regulator [Melioribacter sp.]
MKSILIIDDEKEICESIKMTLEYEDYSVDYTTDSNKGLEKLEYGIYDALLLDIQMPDKSGFDILKFVNEKNIDIKVIIISAFANIQNAIQATKLGAFDFLEKPIDREKLLISVRNAVEQSNLIKENKKLKTFSELEEKIIGKSLAIQKILETITKVAKTDARILITGENGTGKELVAQEIHRQSNRSHKDLIEVNCAAIPQELIESELFGHEKGSFTGAIKQRIGKFELADGSNLFLDEIGDMSLQAQAKVLRAIEEGKIERVGGSNKIEVDVRIISATNKDLLKEIEKGNFREDLYHRLNVIPIHIPPLRERKEDIPLLIEHFSKIICNKNKFPQKTWHEDTIKILQDLPWKGNVRELRNFIERVVIMESSALITPKEIKSYLPDSSSRLDEILNTSNTFQEFKEKAEKAFIQKQLEANGWNISKTADILGIQRSHLYNKIKKYGIEKR